jgi:IclR family mhp operon transcriptional activator
MLETISRNGPATAANIAALTRVDRTTTYRLLETMRRDGYLHYNEDSKHYSMAEAMTRLVDGVSAVDLTSTVVSAELSRLLPKVQWPSDFATVSVGELVIRDSTHRLSPFSIHRAMVGRSRSLLDSALGRAVIAAATDEDRQQLVELSVRHGKIGATEFGVDAKVKQIISDFKVKGYTWSVDNTETGISAIALPVRDPFNVIGAVNIIFFTSALSPAEAAQKYLSYLTDTVTRIEARISQIIR